MCEQLHDMEFGEGATERSVSTVERLVMNASEVTKLHDEMMDSINERIKTHNLTPETTAKILCEMARNALACLAWQPQNISAALDSINEARFHLDES